MHFDAKQWRNNLQQPHSCDPYSVLCSVAFRSSLVRSLLLDLNPHGENAPDEMFPQNVPLHKPVAWELAPKLAIISRHLVRGGSFPAC